MKREVPGKKFDAMQARVIDADNMKVLEYFNPAEMDTIKKKYEDMGKWQDVGVDRDGDLILWKE